MNNKVNKLSQEQWESQEVRTYSRDPIFIVKCNNKLHYNIIVRCRRRVIFTVVLKNNTNCSNIKLLEFIRYDYSLVICVRRNRLYLFLKFESVEAFRKSMSSEFQRVVPKVRTL